MINHSDSIKKKVITVTVGDHFQYDDYEDGEVSFVIPEDNILMHPFYDDNMISTDICILKIPKGQEITFGPNIQPACLPNMADNFTDKTCWAAGWGNTQVNGYPNELREVDVKIFPQEYCINKYNTAYDRKFYFFIVLNCSGAYDELSLSLYTVVGGTPTNKTRYS